jgi:hypothetical protein
MIETSQNIETIDYSNTKKKLNCIFKFILCKIFLWILAIITIIIGVLFGVGVPIYYLNNPTIYVILISIAGNSILLFGIIFLNICIWKCIVNCKKKIKYDVVDIS